MKSLSKALFIIIPLVTLTLGAVGQTKYIDPDILDIDLIRAEEQLEETTIINRIYIFLAIQEGSGFDIYAGKFQYDPAQQALTKDMNELKHYIDAGHIDKKINITEDMYTSYITAMPKFKKLFPNKTNPFSDDSMVEILTEKQLDNPNTLVGSKTLPLVNFSGESIAIEHFIAFYNLASPKKEEKSNDEKKEDSSQVTSYGFIEIKFIDDKQE